MSWFCQLTIGVVFFLWLCEIVGPSPNQSDASSKCAIESPIPILEEAPNAMRCSSSSGRRFVVHGNYNYAKGIKERKRETPILPRSSQVERNTSFKLRPSAHTLFDSALPGSPDWSASMLNTWDIAIFDKRDEISRYLCIPINKSDRPSEQVTDW